MERITSEELRAEMSQHYGTTAYHRAGLATVLTDGMRAVCEKAGAYWLASEMDLFTMFNRSIKAKAKAQDIVFWRLTVKDEKAKLEAFEDIPGRKLASKNISYTDFPAGEWKFYQCGQVIMLPSEY